jgi:competence protein ComEA
VGDRAGFELSFSAGQRRAVGALLVCAIALCGWRLLSDRVTIPDPQPPRGDRFADLADRIDPNTAETADLATIPGLGSKRAQALVDWRTAARTRDGQATVFRRPEDLYKVRGIGPALVDQMRPYLIFPPPGATTTPTPP